MLQFFIWHSQTMVSYCRFLHRAQARPSIHFGNYLNHWLMATAFLVGSTTVSPLTLAHSPGHLRLSSLTISLPADSPTIAPSAKLHFLAQTSPSPSKPITNDEVQSYATAVLAMEPLRQTAYAEIKRIVGSGNVPNIACYLRQEFDKLPADIRLIANNFCDQSKRIVEISGLSINRFNEITMQQEDDITLQQRIQAQLVRLQEQASPPKQNR